MTALTTRSISAFENGEYPPSLDTLQSLATALAFPSTFFQGDDLDCPSADTVSFRALKRMSAGRRDTALGSGALAFLLNDWIERRFELPAPNLPDLRFERTPEAAAESLRQHWDLGEKSIKNMVHLLEAHGVRVYSLAIDALEVDAFSLWRDETPFVFVNTKKSAEHARFDVAHELGHLVLHRHGSPRGQAAEVEANRFASDFLMPKRTVLAHAHRLPTLDQLVQIKKIWNVSVAALNYRLHSIGVTTDWHYRTLCIALSQRGFRSKEPNESQRETSQILSKVFAALRDDGISKTDVAKDICVCAEEIEELVFGLALTAISGTKIGRSSSPRRSPPLRLLT